MVYSHIFSKTAHSDNNDELKFKLKDNLLLHKDSFTEDLPSFSAPTPPPPPPTIPIKDSKKLKAKSVSHINKIQRPPLPSR